MLALSASGAEATALSEPNGPSELGVAVFRVRAVEASGRVDNGSAVLIAPGKLVTACHVTRNAQSIELSNGGTTWAARACAADIPHDLCVLSAPGLASANPVVIAAQGDLKPGHEVIAVGYPHGGKLVIRRGKVKALHPYHGASVLQVSAPFDHGQSGGALFDARGRLVGITAFKAVAGGDFHFALPLQWLPESALRDDQLPASSRDPRARAFWERARESQPLFLRAASLEADGKWEALSDVAREWVRVDHANPASWLALGRALDRLRRADEAAEAYRRAALLEPSSADRP
jgi:hypothetical protein